MYECGACIRQNERRKTERRAWKNFQTVHTSKTTSCKLLDPCRYEFCIICKPMRAYYYNACGCCCILVNEFVVPLYSGEINTRAAYVCVLGMRPLRERQHHQRDYLYTMLSPRKRDAGMPYFAD